MATPAQLAQLAQLTAILPGVGGIAATTNAGDYIAQDMMWSDRNCCYIWKNDSTCFRHS